MSPVSAAALIAGRYRLDHRMAADLSGEVWQGTDTELARHVAVKLLRDDAAAEAVSRFRAAARRAASVTHEGLVRVFDYYGEPDLPESRPRPLLVMEYVDGPSLAARLRTGPLLAEQAADILAVISAAVRAVHQAGLAHGDIRPEKILLPPAGGAKLLGFAGTCPAGPAATAADLRALGALVSDCLAGAAAPRGSTLATGQLQAATAELAALCARPAVHGPDAAAAVASRAAELRAQLGQPAADGPRPTASADPLWRRDAEPSITPPALLPPSPPAPAPGPPAQTPTPTGTLPGLPAADPAGQPPAEPGQQRPARRGTAAAVRAAVVIAAALAAIAIVGALKPNPSATGPSEANAASVRVTAARLIGQPVRVVRHRLQLAGLTVRTRWQHSDSITAGDVIAVRPAGLVPPHSTVVITGSSGPSAIAPAAAPSHARTSHRTASGSPTPPPSPSPSSSPTPSPSPTSPSPSSSPPPSSTPSPSAGTAG